MSRPRIAPQRRRLAEPSHDTDRPAPLPPLRVVDLPSHGAEDVLVDDAGRVLTGTEDGCIFRVSPDGGVVELVAETGGRPLGLEFLPDRTLLVCDAYRGLLHLDLRTETEEVWAYRVEGAPMMFCNNAAVASDGTVYFTDSSTRFGIEHWKADLLEQSATGRLFRRTADGAVDLVCDGLSFANGVALTDDEESVVVAETARCALRRVWLTDPRAGREEAFAPGLPGFPDNISTGSDGLVWVSVASPRDRALELLAPRWPLLRRLVWALPERMQPSPARTVRVQAYD
ncbi:MAG: SMP-30/gluconolactonase/LRE family protein, partial [Thermocrispum sp.]